MADVNFRAMNLGRGKPHSCKGEGNHFAEQSLGEEETIVGRDHTISPG